jgi:hypothetical protein
MDAHLSPESGSGVRRAGEALALAGAALMVIASFLPWYEIDLIIAKGRLNGWQDPGLIWSFLALMISVVFAALVLRRRLDPQGLPRLPGRLTWGMALAVMGVLPLLCVTLKLLNDSDFVAYGFYVAFAAAALQALGGALAYVVERAG